MTIQAGSIVKHLKIKAYRRGTVKEISKSGKRAYVLFHRGTDNPDLLWDQISYYRLDLLEEIEEETPCAVKTTES